MRILVVSLLRMGDLVMAAEAIAGLRRKHPKAEIDLLTNDSNRSIASMIPGINKTFLFSRGSLQKDLGEAHRPIVAGLDALRALVFEINRQEYDLLINLTQNKLSGYLCALIDAKEKNGLIMNENDQPYFGSPWFRHLNDFAHVGVNHFFHFVDIFKAATGIDGRAVNVLTVTPEGEREIEKYEFSKPTMVIQPFTSDEKKNWLSSQWAEFISTFLKLHPEYDIHVFGAPDEMLQVNEIVAAAREKGSSVQATSLSLQGAFAFLKKAQICVSTDTSIKHLAAAAGTPKIVELVLGGSDYKRTGAYKDQTLIIRSNESCQPCSHSSPCHRSDRFCASRVTADAVVSLTTQYLRNDIVSLKTVAQEFSDEVITYMGRISKAGFWWPENLCDANANPSCLLELFGWKMILEKQHLERIAPYGDQVRDLNATLGENSVSKSVIDGMSREYQHKSARITQMQSEIVKLLKQNLGMKECSSIENRIAALERELQWKDFLLPRWKELSGHGLGRIRQIQRLLSEADQLQQIRLKMLQTLRDLPLESI